MKKLLVICILFLASATNVKALYCSYNDLAHLKKLASNINVSYDYVETTDVIFSINLINVPTNMYVIDLTTNETYKGSEIVIPNYKSGTTVKLDIYSDKVDCENEILSTLRLSLPSYNPFYKDSLCQGISDYTLCQKWSSHNLSYDKFKEKIENYLKSDEVKPPDEEKKEIVNNWWSKILSVILDYYYVPLGIVIIGSSIAIYVINKKSNAYS